MDIVRRGYHQKLQMINDYQRVKNTAVNDFLFNQSSSSGAGDLSMAFPGSKGIKKLKDDSEEIEDDQSYIKGMKLMPHQVLDYIRWRKEIIPALTTQLLG